MTQDQRTNISPREFLEALRKLPRLTNFNLAVYCPKGNLAQKRQAQQELGKAIGYQSLCGPSCLKDHREAACQALAEGNPLVFRCSSGLWNFAVPLPKEEIPLGCLLAGGIRDLVPDLKLLEKLSNATSDTGEPLLERLEKLPALTRQQVEETAAEIHQALPSLLGGRIYALALNKTSRRLSALTEVSTAIDNARSREELAELLNETLAILFDLPRLALVLEQQDSQGYQLQSALGLPQERLQLAPRRIAELLSEHPACKPVTLWGETQSLFPQITAGRTLVFPMASGGEPLGLLALFDSELPNRDLLLIELLIGRVSAKLLHLRQEREHQRKSDFSTQLITMISALSIIQSRQELYRKIVDLAADLLQATRGSLMLFDQSGETLSIVAAKGMNQALARSMSVRSDEGIAGKVVRSGFPLLVNDIEKDRRTAIANRPRFKHKSFISLPFKVKDRVIGVLNFSDKEGQPTFSQTDLDLLSSFAAHAALMIDRAASLERTTVLEEMSVTDPLTGIHNRRLLEERLQEELNRSSRQGLEFTVMLIDLDHFKIFNDLCGHLAGDKALKRAAALLKSSARDMDIVTRYGGEEFCIVLPGTNKKEAIFVAERIRRAIENETFPGEEGLPLGRLTTSIGLSCFPQDGDSTSSLINAADIALYKAKEEGRNRLVLFQPSLKDNPKENHG